MTPPFSVNATPHDRLARRLARQHPEFDAIEESARVILHADPRHFREWGLLFTGRVAVALCQNYEPRRQLA